MRAAPAVSRAMCIKECCTRAYRFSGEHPAFPAQWLYGLYVIVLVTGFLATIIAEKRWLLADLTPAPGRRTQTISPYASAALVSRSLRVHRSLPLVCDDGQRPSGGTGWREVVRCFYLRAEAEYFSRQHWTGGITLKSLKKLV